MRHRFRPRPHRAAASFFLVSPFFWAVLFVGVTVAAPPSAPWFPKAPPLPQPSGNVIHVTTVEGLHRAAKVVKSGGTISLADGFYPMDRYLEITVDNVTLRGQSPDRDRVILDGASSRHGELIGITGCKGVTIANLTIQNIKWNGFKINSDRGTEGVTIYNCVIHNVWQRGVKAPAVPEAQQKELAARDCRVLYSLFYNDRSKRFSDDETDTPRTFNGNYIGGIDAKNTINWQITDNVFIGIQGRTREGRGCIYISENGRGCVIERNLFIDCDIAIALGNPSLGYSPLQAIDCVARNNFVSHCPETGILACHTRDCQILNNTIHDPKSSRQRLIWVQESNPGLQVRNNLLIGPPIQITSTDTIRQSRNEARNQLAGELNTGDGGIGQNLLSTAEMEQAIAFQALRRSEKTGPDEARLRVGLQRPEVLAAMRNVHAGFKGARGYVAQFGDSITYSMAFWAPIGWDAPERHLTDDDGLPKTPEESRWRDYVKGTRDKGPSFANYSGWNVTDLLGSVDTVLQREQPEAAIIMIGTNDINPGQVPKSYRASLEEIIAKCVTANCIPILNTIPPRRGRETAVNEVNRIIRDVASEQNIPLADFYAECLRLRPGTSWDGTLISADGVHPTGGESNDYSEANLRTSGYALRNWVNFLVLRQLYFNVMSKR